MNPPPDVLRYGIIGSGTMGREHIGNVLALEGAEITALADPHEPSIERSLACVTQDSRPETFSDHRDLLRSGLCDVAVIASPNHTHRDLLLDALAAPVHILMEKPLAELRTDLAKLGFARAEDVSEPEDHVAALCEVMSVLVGGEDAVDLDAQQGFFETHLAPWIGRFFASRAISMSDLTAMASFLVPGVHRL